MVRNEEKVRKETAKSLVDKSIGEKHKNLIKEVVCAVEVIKNAILQSQESTARNINANLLALNYAIGGFISQQSKLHFWGSGVIKSISEKLQKELPGLRGFGYENLKKMRQFYEAWNPYIIGSPMATPKDENSKDSPTLAKIILPVLQSQFAMNSIGVEASHAFLSISFTHHMEILNKTKTLEERLFYIQQTASYKWDKYRLREFLKQDLFHHQSEMPNNFLSTMSKRVQALKAIEMFKDEYLMDYINVEELGVRDEVEIDEKVIEASIIQNVKNFIMTFGSDFTFVGNQYHLQKFNKDHFVDMLFYNRELSCLVAVELKKGEFKPMYLAQLQTYLQILDDEVRKPQENPSIGIILCQDINKAYVEYVIQRYDSPMGVAAYKTVSDMPERLRNALPDVEDLKRLISENGD